MRRGGKELETGNRAIMRGTGHGLLSWLALGAGTMAVTYALVLRPWHRRWGATEEEANRALPGDELVPDPKFHATHAITIEAPPAEVWPWLVQMGQGRGGLYSYETPA